MRFAAIIVAAGKGLRAGGEIPKQFQKMGGKPVFRWSLDAFIAHDQIEAYVLVVPQGDEGSYQSVSSKCVKIVPGGASRTASVQAGIAACKLSPNDTVLIHDAARPGLTNRVISDLVTAMTSADAAAPALPIADALKRKGSNYLSTIDRDQLYRVQTPQAFRFGLIQSALATQHDLVDDLAAIEAMNGKVELTQGHEHLAKITFPEDQSRLEKLLMPSPAPPRFGMGYDVHALQPGDHVTLCGVAIPHTHSLVGHSNADVAWHALTDAILGAAALGDIGDHFPPSDPKWEGADSAIFLKHAVDIATENGWTLTSCDLTVICEAPKVKPHREEMRKRTAEVTGLPIEAISIKATTTEGLGFTGRREGIAAQASAVLAPATLAD